MKILLLNWMDMANPMMGGAEVHLIEIFQRFVERGDDVTLIASGFKGSSARDEYKGIKVIRTGSRATFNFMAPPLIRRIEKSQDFDLIVEDINKVPLFSPTLIMRTTKPGKISASLKLSDMPSPCSRKPLTSANLSR